MFINTWDVIRVSPIALVAILAMGVLAGCITFEQPRQLDVQPGDFVRADLVRRVANGSTETFREAHLYLGSELPRRLPPGWDANATRTAVPGLVEAMDGMEPGETRKTGWLGPEQAYGPRDPKLVDLYNRSAALPRRVDATGDGGVVEAYGRTWNATTRNGTARIRVSETDVGTLVEHPRFWDPGNGTRMWPSRLTGSNATHLLVQHRAQVGQNVTRAGVTGRVVTVNATRIAVDRNHRLAGRRAAFNVTLQEIVFVEPGKTRAPSLEIRSLDGQAFDPSAPGGRPMLVYFFATWCTLCKIQTPNVLQAKAELGAEVTVLAVTLDPNEQPATIRDYAEQMRAKAGTGDVNVSWAIDGQQGAPTSVGSGRISTTFRVFAIPRQFVIGPDGLMEWSQTGVASTSELVAELQKVDV